MPASRTIKRTIETNEFDVLGQDDGPDYFIRHTGLAKENGVTERRRVKVHEMGPPLQSSGLINANVQGSAALDDDETRKIRSFIDRHQSEHEARHFGKLKDYCIYPHFRREPESELDGTYAYTRFSCAGFVIEAYRFAGIELINLERVPPVAFKAVAEAYPKYRESLTQKTVQKRLGIDVGFPLQIVFCGYVMHAMNRTPEQIRGGAYAPSVSDAIFE